MLLLSLSRFERLQLYQVWTFLFSFNFRWLGPSILNALQYLSQVDYENTIFIAWNIVKCNRFLESTFCSSGSLILIPTHKLVLKNLHSYMLNFKKSLDEDTKLHILSCLWQQLENLHQPTYWVFLQHLIIILWRSLWNKT